MLSRRFLTTTLFAFMSWPVLTYGQQFTSGQISGFVFDSSGAPVPNAVVTAEEVLTHASRQISTGDNGYFIFANIPVGTYTVSTEVSGFKRSTESGLILDAGGKLAVTFKLEVGSAAQSVDVKASRAPVESETAQVGRLVEQQQLLELPVNGRNMGNYLMFEPGVSNLRQPNVSAGTDNFGIRRFSINGSNDSETHVTVDGIEAIRTDGGGATIGMTSPDSLQEVRVLTSNYLAEYGRGGGAQVIYVTRSGTSQFHGGLYEFGENDILNARGYFAATKPKLRQNLFGGNLGGPVYMPGKWNKDKNKAFFFYSGEMLRIRNETQAIALVPTAAQRAGNFSGSGTAPIDPLTKLPFPGAIIPANRISQNGPALLSMYPDPNANLPGGNYSALGKNWTNQSIQQMKGDYDLGNTRLSASINLTRLDFENAFRGSFALLPDLEHRYGYREGITATTTIRPNLLNQFQFGYSTDHEALLRVGVGVDRSTYGINFPYVFPEQYKDGNKIPTLNVSGLAQIDGGNYLTAGHRGPIFNAHDDMTWNHGSHTIRFGAVAERTGLNTSDQAKGDQNGIFTFAASSLNPGTTRNPIADVLLGNFD
ncbi:MAG TPA: carboxypeptidase regulatory-like domain-containing protein, partial [Bryobacteraceae bacterium]